MVNVVTMAAYWLRLIGLVQRLAATWRSVLHSSDEPGELSQWQCTATMIAPSTINIVVAITVTITIKHTTARNYTGEYKYRLTNK